MFAGGEEETLLLRAAIGSGNSAEDQAGNRGGCAARADPIGDKLVYRSVGTLTPPGEAAGLVVIVGGPLTGQFFDDDEVLFESRRAARSSS